MIPILYSSTEEDYTHNGIAPLKESIEATVTEEANGLLELYLEYPVNGMWSKEIKDQRLIKAKPNDLDEPHVFRIYEIVKDMDEQLIYIYASSITNDLGLDLVKSVTVTDATGQQAMNAIKTNLTQGSTLTLGSNIATKSSTEWSMRNPLNCIVGEEGSIVQRWGGELKRNNDGLYLYSRRGRDDVAVIRQGKNLEGFDMSVTTQGLITRILPYASVRDSETGEESEIVGSVVNSPRMNNYPVRSIVAVDYTDESINTVAQLNSAAAKYFSARNPDSDKPKVRFNIDMLQLSNTSYYAKFKKLESVGVFDTVTVYVPTFDVNVNVKIRQVEYDVLREKTVRIIAGDPVNDIFSDIRNDYSNVINDKVRHLDGVIQRASNGKNRIYRSVAEPTTGMIKNDLWYKPVGSGETELYRFDGSYWKLEKVSAGLLGGTLDVENGDVDLINVNVANIVGDTSSFIQSWWNGINSHITIDSTKFEGGDLDGNRSTINASGQFISWAGTDGRYGIFEKGRIWFYNEDGSAVLNIGAHPVTGETGLLKGVLATARAQRLIFGRYNDYLTNNINATVNPYISFEYGATVGDEGNVYIKNWKDVSMNGKHINDVQSVGGYELEVRSTQGPLILGAPQPDGQRYNTLEVSFANTKSNGNIDMGGYTITNQSDIRLKTNVVESELSALHEIERMKFIEYDWDLENPANDKKPTERQFGIVAQYSPFLQTKARGSESYLSVDMSKQVNLNSKAIQELKKENDTLKQELADLKAILSEKGLI